MAQIPDMPIIETHLKSTSLHYAILTFIMVQFLFFLDEGLFSFEWMNNPGAWFVFLIYFSVVMISQLTLYSIFTKFGWESFAKTISFILGSIIGLVALFNLIF